MLAEVVLEPESSRAGGDGEQVQEGMGGGTPTWDRWGRAVEKYIPGFQLKSMPAVVCPMV